MNAVVKDSVMSSIVHVFFIRTNFALLVYVAPTV